jgi:hypothetical protein
MRGVEVRVWHFSEKEPRTARGHLIETYIKKWSIGYILDLGVLQNRPDLGPGI